MKENPKIKYVIDGETEEHVGWWSRSMAVCVALYDFNKESFILEKRGPGCPDEIGKYVHPCGYVAWGETLRDAACREVYEETGIKLTPDLIFPAGVNDDPKENRQNVTFRFLAMVNSDDLDIDLNSESRGGEEGEVSSIEVKTADWIFSNPKEMGFSHEKVTRELLQNFDAIINRQFWIDSIDREELEKLTESSDNFTNWVKKKLIERGEKALIIPPKDKEDGWNYMVDINKKYGDVRCWKVWNREHLITGCDGWENNIDYLYAEGVRLYGE